MFPLKPCDVLRCREGTQIFKQLTTPFFVVLLSVTPFYIKIHWVSKYIFIVKAFEKWNGSDVESSRPGSETGLWPEVPWISVFFIGQSWWYFALLGGARHWRIHWCCNVGKPKTSVLSGWRNRAYRQILCMFSYSCILHIQFNSSFKAPPCLTWSRNSMIILRIIVSERWR